MSLKQLVNSHDVYQSFLKYINDMIALRQKSLETAIEPHDIYRIQGQIKELRRLLTMRDEVNAMDK